MDMDFEKFFDGLVKMGVPHPRKDPEFRASLIEALMDMDREDQQPQKEEKEEFQFSELILKNKTELLHSRFTSDAMRDRVANWFLTAFEKGYIKSAEKEQDAD
jgi:hypothetical protein